MKLGNLVPFFSMIVFLFFLGCGDLNEPVQLGETCQTQADCPGGVDCVNNRCDYPTGPCVYNDDCGSGYECINSACVGPGGNPGSCYGKSRAHIEVGFRNPGSPYQYARLHAAVMGSESNLSAFSDGYTENLDVAPVSAGRVVFDGCLGGEGGNIVRINGGFCYGPNPSDCDYGNDSFCLGHENTSGSDVRTGGTERFNQQITYVSASIDGRELRGDEFLWSPQNCRDSWGNPQSGDRCGCSIVLSN